MFNTVAYADRSWTCEAVALLVLRIRSSTACRSSCSSDRAPGVWALSCDKDATSFARFARSSMSEASTPSDSKVVTSGLILFPADSPSSLLCYRLRGGRMAATPLDGDSRFCDSRTCSAMLRPEPPHGRSSGVLGACIRLRNFEYSVAACADSRFNWGPSTAFQSSVQRAVESTYEVDPLVRPPIVGCVLEDLFDAMLAGFHCFCMACKLSSSASI